MSTINFDLPADLFWTKTSSRNLRKAAVAHQRFATLAEAIRAVVEEPTVKRFAISIDTDDTSFSLEEAQVLYQSDGFATYRDGNQASAG